MAQLHEAEFGFVSQGKEMMTDPPFTASNYLLLNSNILARIEKAFELSGRD